MEGKRILIFGCGRTGSRVARALWERGYRVTVIDSEPDRFLFLPPEMLEDEEATFLGNATLDEDLERAGIRQAQVFVAVSDRDNLNAFSALKARYIFEVPRVVCRIGDPDRRGMYERLGLTVVSSTPVMADLVLDAIFKGGDPPCT